MLLCGSDASESVEEAAEPLRELVADKSLYRCSLNEIAEAASPSEVGLLVAVEQSIPEAPARRHASLSPEQLYSKLGNVLRDDAALLALNCRRGEPGAIGRFVLEAIRDGWTVWCWEEGAVALSRAQTPGVDRTLLPQSWPAPDEMPFEEAMRRHQQGDNWLAEIVYRHFVRREPEHAGALHLLGVCCHQRAKHEEALEWIGWAIRVRPDQGVYFNNYGAALLELGRTVEALAAFHRSVALRPNYADAHSNLGLAYDRLGRPAEARAAHEKALELAPDHFDALTRLAKLLAREGKAGDAVRLLTAAVSRAAGSWRLQQELGKALAAAERPAAAAEAFKRAAALNANHGETWLQLATTLIDTGEEAAAAEALDRAVALDPHRPLWHMRRLEFCPAVFESTAAIDGYRERLLEELQRWEANPPDIDWRELGASGIYPSFNLLHHGRNERPLREAFHRVFARYFPEWEPLAVRGKPRVGFVVTRGHEGIFRKSLAGVLRGLPQAEYSLVVYCPAAAETSMREGLACPAVDVRPLPERFEEAAEFLRNERLALLYHWEIGSDSLNYHLAYLRLAPIQATSYGIPATSGLPTIDAYLSSKFVEPPEAQQHYRERLLVLPTLFSVQERAKLVRPATRAEFELPEDANLYFFPQRLLKFHPDCDGLFAKILERDPQALIVALQSRKQPHNETLRERLRRTVPEHHERIVLGRLRPHAEYLRWLSLADVVLDPPHYSAASSAYDIFSLNLPLVTLPGQFAASRYGAGFYQILGEERLVANDPASYVEAATQLGSNPDTRHDIRQSIADCSDLLFDGGPIVNAYHSAFCQLLAGE